MSTKIEWVRNADGSQGETINPFRARNKATGAVGHFDAPKLQAVLRRRKPTTWFWFDKTDMFCDGYPDEWRDRCFAVMALTPQHTHIVLTKRAARMRGWFERLQRIADDWAPKTKRGEFNPANVLNLHWMHWTYGRGPAFPYHPWPLPNVRLGVSISNQEDADRDLPILLQTPATVHFVSCEPLLGPLDLSRWL